jgi:hypothetical protein
MLRKLAAAVVAGVALVAGFSLPASAAGNPPGYIRPVTGPDGNHIYEWSNWGGRFFYATVEDSRWIMPNGYYQVFVVGTDHKLWTRWNSKAGLAAWTDRLGGRCQGTVRPRFKASGYNVTVRCYGMDDNYWINTRNTAGAWTGWRTDPDQTPTN